MNDNIFKYNELRKAEFDERFKKFCEVYATGLKHSKKEWLDILKANGVEITRMTLHRYTQKYIEEDVTYEGRNVTHEEEGVTCEEIAKATRENPIIKEIFLQERTTGTKFDINPDEVVPRYLKSAEIKKKRKKSKAEVFTSVEIVKIMNEEWEEDKGSDLDYIKKSVIEATCGEAPFLTTRYDAATGRMIPINERVGILDRKLQHIHTDNEMKWCELAELALKSVHGYEWQEDSLFLARMNVLMAVVESFAYQFGKIPKGITKLAKIISYNFFRMDGITFCLPETQIPAMVMNWNTEKLERLYEEI